MVYEYAFLSIDLHNFIDLHNLLIGERNLHISNELLDLHNKVMDGPVMIQVFFIIIVIYFIYFFFFFSIS